MVRAGRIRGSRFREALLVGAWAGTLRWNSLLMWIVGLAASISGLHLGRLPPKVVDRMWKDSLFSEYVPPRPMHVHLIESLRSSSFMHNTAETKMWDAPGDNGWKPCSERKQEKFSDHGNGYFQVFCGGGLFQLHICVCNAVAVARLLNATLLIPYFKEYPFWKDPSKFEDIYDVDHFISYLKDNVQVVRELPPEYRWSTPGYYWNRCLERSNCLTFLPKHATMKWYFENAFPVLKRYHLLVIDGFEHKLSFEGLPDYITRLRCNANFYGLRFVKPIRNLGELLTLRMRNKRRTPLAEGSPLSRQLLSINASDMASWVQWAWSILQNEEAETKQLGLDASLFQTSASNYVGLHVRFEKDMVAHSACDYGGGRAERKSLASFRYHVWRNQVKKAQFKPEDLRKNGSCPLTPEELALFLAALGFTDTTPIYIAGKELYGGEQRMKPLRQLFPYVDNKFTLATRKELKPFLRFSHQLAALDFIVLLNSNVFMSNAAGNFPNVLTGHRTFFGPKKSIHPDKAYLVNLFSNTSLTWKDFAAKAVAAHQLRQGAPAVRRFRYSLYRYPASDCMCQIGAQNRTLSAV